MARKMIVTSDSVTMTLIETSAEDEAQLQRLLRDNPDLLPVEEFGMAGPLLVVGKETRLPSGRVDLVALCRSGELLIIEFKTGPQNQDFRRALAQLLDYGSDLWRMTYDEFEATVAIRYFESPECTDSRMRMVKSLRAAATMIWPDSGVAIRLPTADGPPLTVAWVFQPDRSGWLGMTDLNLGFSKASAASHPSLGPALLSYIDQIKGIPGAEPVKQADLHESVYRIPPTVASKNAAELFRMVAALMSRSNSDE